jgi:hypothetical protein
MPPQPGTHPNAGEANAIVFASCEPEFPNATLIDTVGKLYPLASERAIFVDRIVKNTKTAGYAIVPPKVPVGDTDTLGDVSGAVVENAVA